MDKFTGIRALKRTIELILQKVNKYQEAMNEMSREELIELMAENNLDLSWIASQESVNAVKADLVEIKTQISQLQSAVANISNIVDPDPNPERTMAPDGELEKWEYELTTDDDGQNWVNLNNYIGTDPVVHIYDRYRAPSGNRCFTKLNGFGTSGKAVISKFDTDPYVVSGAVTLTNMENLEEFSFSGTAKPTVSELNSMFAGCKKLKSADMTMFNVNIIDGGAMSMFKDCENLRSITGMQGSWFNTRSTTSMIDRMFGNCKSLKTIDLRMGTNASTAYRSADRMFEGCDNLESVKLCVSGYRSTVLPLWDGFKDCPKLSYVGFYDMKTSLTATQKGNIFTGTTTYNTINELSTLPANNVFTGIE